MIKLERNFTPLCLVPNQALKLTQEFALTGKSVWNIDALKSALLETSHNKCAYCECNLTNESKYVEVEHFLNKDRYPEHVVTWENLLPSCKRCNGKKGSHDVLAEPIINPYKENPTQHFKLKNYRLKPKSEIAHNTIDVIDLNNYDRVLKVRFEVGESIQQSLEITLTALNLYTSSPKTRNKNKLLALTTQILTECQPDATYSATASTILHDSDHYIELKSALKANNLWSNELNTLHQNSKNSSLETI